MSVSTATMLDWCRTLMGANPGAPKLSLEQYLAGIPRLERLSDVPAGTAVLVRGDVDAKPGEKVGQGDERLRSMTSTLQFGQKHGWKQVIFGHIGRKPEGSLKGVAKRFGEILGTQVNLVADWWDDSSRSLRPELTQALAALPNGGILVLENTRKYAIERVLWDIQAEDLPQQVDGLTRLANELAEKVASVYVHEAFSAGSMDASSVVVPAAMKRVALGHYAAGEFDGPMRRCLQAQLVVFSGLKIDKLDDLQAMIDRGTVRMVITAGSLAMALKKADAQLAGGDFHLGKAEDPAEAEKPYYIPHDRVDQAKHMLSAGRAKGIQFVLPVDFILEDGTASDTIGPGHQQFDIGPKTIAHFSDQVDHFIKAHQSDLKAGRKPVMFHNGVFGMFEDPRFETGTREFVSQLRKMTQAGIEVFVGGGEGGTALTRYGQPDWVTHCFTAGGTVLNALGSLPVPYLQALYLAAHRD